MELVIKVISSIKKHYFFRSLNARLRIVFRIVNKNVYHEYTRCAEYKRLYNKYQVLIDRGVNISENHNRCNIIWVCWLQGLEQAPPLVRACINSLRIAAQNMKIVVLTEENIKDYIVLPKHIIEKKNKGIIPAAQFTDILRTALLCKYGGGWIDATVLCTSERLPEYLTESPLFVFKQMDLLRKDFSPVLMSNWLIFSESNNQILSLTLELLYKYWEDHNYLSHYFIYHLLFSMSARRYPNIWNRIPTFNNHSPHILQFELKEKFSKNRWDQIKYMSDFHKLNRRIIADEYDNSFYGFIIKKYFEQKYCQ